MTTKMTLQDVRDAFEQAGIYCRQASHCSLALHRAPGVIRVDQYGRAWFEVSRPASRPPRMYTDVASLVSAVVAHLEALDVLGG